MSDQNLRDDMLKLVRYKILFLNRDYEHAFPEQEELVADNLDATNYTNVEDCGIHPAPAPTYYPSSSEVEAVST
jgi:hypothetical protein